MMTERMVDQKEGKSYSRLMHRKDGRSKGWMERMDGKDGWTGWMERMDGKDGSKPRTETTDRNHGPKPRTETTAPRGN